MVLFLAGCFVAVGAAPAQACTCSTPPTTLMQRIKTADGVFTGRVTAVQRDEATAGELATITNTTEIDRVYKGGVQDPVQEVVTSQRTQASCGLGQLKTDRRYVFIVAATDTGWTDDGCSGTRIATESLIGDVQALLGSGRSPTPPPPPPAAVLTDIDTTPPTALSRAVAPGLSFLIVGLLGLILVRRLGSRRA